MNGNKFFELAEAKRNSYYLEQSWLQGLMVILLGLTIGTPVRLDPDMYWHLATGRWIAQNGALPHVDVFSWTVPGREWVNHEWLTQQFMYGVYEVGGYGLLLLVFAAIYALAFYVVYTTTHGRWVVVCIGIIVSFTAAGARPQVLPLLWAALLIRLLQWDKDYGNPLRDFALIPAVLSYWAFTHGSYPLGFLLVGFMGLWYWPFFLSLAFALLFVGLHPYAPQIFYYPILTLTSDFMREHIVEWHAPLSPAYMVWWGYVLMTAGAVYRAITEKTFHARDSFVGPLILLGCTSIRHIPLAVILTLPFTMQYLNIYGVFKPFSLLVVEAKRWAVAGQFIILILSWLVLPFYGLESRYPAGALPYLAGEDVKVFNQYNWGGYLIWNGIEVFADGRADMYGDQYLFEYVAIQEGHTQQLAKRGVTHVLVSPSSKLISQLEAEGWKLIYEDELSVVYQR